jgi:hypothetical protein
MTKPKSPLLSVGDRVRERDRVADHVVTPTSPSFQQVRGILSQRRYGIVVGVEIKKSIRGSACKYIHVQWDHLNTPSVHASSRIEKVAD